MALTPCKECEANIHHKARVCPQCGVLIHDKGFWWVLGLYAVVMLSSVFVYLRIDTTDGLLIMLGGCFTFAILIIRKLS